MSLQALLPGSSFFRKILAEKTPVHCSRTHKMCQKKVCLKRLRLKPRPSHLGRFGQGLFAGGSFWRAFVKFPQTVYHIATGGKQDLNPKLINGVVGPILWRGLITGFSGYPRPFPP
jgi:hypothetical protein